MALQRRSPVTAMLYSGIAPSVGKTAGQQCLQELLGKPLVTPHVHMHCDCALQSSMHGGCQSVHAPRDSDVSLSGLQPVPWVLKFVKVEETTQRLQRRGASTSSARNPS